MRKMTQSTTKKSVILIFSYILFYLLVFMPKKEIRKSPLPGLLLEIRCLISSTLEKIHGNFISQQNLKKKNI